MKLNKRQSELANLAVTIATHLVNGQKGTSDIMRSCKTEAEVIFSQTRLESSIESEASKHKGAVSPESIIRTARNNAVKFIARCRNGEDKTPPIWFDKTRTLSFEQAVPEFVEFKPRAIKGKADKQAEAQAQAEAISKQAEAQAEAMFKDKAKLTKVQENKVKKAQAEADKQAKQAQAQAKQAQAKQAQAESEVSKLRGELSALQSKYNVLSDNYGKATRLNEAFKKALQLANVEADAIDAIIRHVK